MSFIQWCCERGAKSHRKRTKKPWRSIKELEIFVSQIFYNFFLFISLFFNYFTLSLFFYTVFTHDIYPHPHPHPHPRPTTSAHDPRHLATLLWITTYGSSEQLNFFDLWNLLRIWDCRPFSGMKTLTGSRAEKSSKCHKTRFRLLSPA